MFKITQQRGFQITFENGITISVQFGTMNYCANRDMYSYITVEPVEPSPNAEIAIWDKDENWFYFEDTYDHVKGWVKPDEVAQWIAKAQAGDLVFTKRETEAAE